jgi:hypothetical protein
VIGARRVLTAVLLATACGALFIGRTFTEFNGVRVRALQVTAQQQDGRVRVTVPDARLNPIGPVAALIARIRNDAETVQDLTFSIDGRPVCTVDVAPLSDRRFDCAGPIANGLAEHEVLVSGKPSAWSVSYVELATHHGRSSGLVDGIILPRASTSYTAPALGWAVAVWLSVVAMLLFVPALPESRRVLRRTARVFTGATALLFAIVAAAPFVSPFRLVLSVPTFVLWLALPLAPPLVPLLHLEVMKIGLQRAIARSKSIWAMRPSAARVERWLAWTLAAGMTGVALWYGGRAVGGSDEYGYVSQADLWLKGDLKTDQSFATKAPWPRGPESFSPLGYLPDPLNSALIVPKYAPGFPMTLALVKAIGGQTAMFFVVPISAGLLVLGTYGLGRRLGSGWAGVIGAWLIATSPVVLFMSMLTMTDVPVAAIWTGAFYWLFADTIAGAALAGLLTGFAVLVRPNLAPLAALVAVYYVVKLFRSDNRRQVLVSLVCFGAAAAPGPILVAIINNYLFGSPAESGYGNLRDLFDRSNIPTNLRLYFGWLVEAHTPIVLSGFIALLLPLRVFWPGITDRLRLIVGGAFVVALWTLYCGWGIFDAWWFCRFLLSSWPWIMIGVGVLAMALMRVIPLAVKPAVIAGLLALGVFQANFGERHTAFLVGRGTVRYAVIARLVHQVTERNSAVMSYTHSGSIRYYGSRMTIDIENFGGYLDLIVEWLASHGVHTYAALEDWEIPMFKERFAGARRLAALSEPIGVFKDPGTFLIFDLTTPEQANETVTTIGMEPVWIAPPPSPPPKLILK